MRVRRVRALCERAVCVRRVHGAPCDFAVCKHRVSVHVCARRVHALCEHALHVCRVHGAPCVSVPVHGSNE